MTSDKVKVALRVRPFNRREVDLGTPSVVSMVDKQTILQMCLDDKIESTRKNKVFTFDMCFDSSDPTSSNFADQKTVFSALGSDILDNIFMGYNACIFAYGQTGSGKSYTMLGSHDSPGIIPRLCNSLFSGILSRTDTGLTFKVEVSYMEIYNEKVHDLLDPGGGRRSLKVREHNLLGPYVDGLSVLAVSSFDDIDRLIVEGNRCRTVAATNMNSESSRSHAVFTVLVTQTLTDCGTGVSGEKVSRVSLVDLAGSERAVKTGAVGARLKEGSNINKSLTTLGLVISKLAETPRARAGDPNFIPYRDSVLTWLLKDNLGGNSKTVMVATVSPAADNYAETLSTLRYADRAKRIVNHAIVNEDPNAKIIRELRKEVEQLREQLVRLKGGEETDAASGGGDGDSCSGGWRLREKLDENEKIMQRMSQPWEERLQRTERVQHKRQQALEKMGISVQTVGISVQNNKFYLVNLNADPAMNEMLVYYLKATTVVGLPDSHVATDIQLCGLGIQPVHCVLYVDGGCLWMEPSENARCCVNGSVVFERVTLRHGDRLLWGNNHFFRVNCPRDTAAAATVVYGACTNGSDVDDGSVLATPAAAVTAVTPGHFDYDYARDELISKQLADSPLQTAIEKLERQHEVDASRQLAIERQQLEYERQFRQLRSSFSTSNLDVSSGGGGVGAGSGCLHDACHDEKQQAFRRNLAHLKQQIMSANAMVREANSMAAELGREITFSLTLQIPPCNLSPNCRRGASACEPAVLVRRPGHAHHVWSMAKMDNQLADMRDVFNEPRVVSAADDNASSHNNDDQEGGHDNYDPFVDVDENHQLIGVANVFLEVLLHDARLTYAVPIISQQGEVVGRLQVDVERVAGTFHDRLADSLSSHSCDSGRSDDVDLLVDTVTCRVTVKQATGLTAAATAAVSFPSMCDFMFCQYNFWGCSETQVCPPIVNHGSTLAGACASASGGSNGADAGSSSSSVVRFHHCRDFVIPVCEEFIEHCAEGALSIEVWRHRSPLLSCIASGAGAAAAAASSCPSAVTGAAAVGGRATHLLVASQRAQARSLADRWSELTRKLQLHVQVLELNEHGEYEPVEVICHPAVCDGDGSVAMGVYQLRQGQQRRVTVGVQAVSQSGTLPLMMDTITGVAVGSVISCGEDMACGGAAAGCPASSQPSLQLDSYQEHDLTQLRHLWSEALTRRRRYLDHHLQAVMRKANRSGGDAERERSLLDQWVLLNEERNAVLLPAAGSGVPGAPLSTDAPRLPGVEPHVPVLFLNLNAEDLTTTASDSKCGVRHERDDRVPAGETSLLAYERGEEMVPLALVRVCDGEDSESCGGTAACVTATAQWDSSVHDAPCLNCVSSSGERVYLVVRVDLRLLQPCSMHVVLRKRLCVTVYKPSLAGKLLRGLALRRCELIHSTAVVYDVVSNVPAACEQLEGRESLAQMAAAAGDACEIDGCTYIEKYLHGVAAVDSLLRVDRLRQSVRVKEQLQSQACALNMRKTASVPNISLFSGRVDAAAAASAGSVSSTNRSESHFELSCVSRGCGVDYIGGDAPAVALNHGHTQRTFAGRMSTLHENLCMEKSNACADASGGRQTSDGTHRSSSTWRHTGVPTLPQTAAGGCGSLSVQRLRFSRTFDSLAELPVQECEDTGRAAAVGGGPGVVASETSSGYGSQTVSASNLLSGLELTSDDDAACVAVPDTVCGVEHVDNAADPVGARRQYVSDGDDHLPTEAGDANCEHTVNGASERRASVGAASSAGAENTATHATVGDETVCGETLPTAVNRTHASYADANCSGGGVDSRWVSPCVAAPPTNCYSAGHVHPSPATECLPVWVCVGEPVLVRPQAQSGVIRHVGPVHFAGGGGWVGVELDSPCGKNDGSVRDVQYFRCRPRHGMFVRVDKLIWDQRRSRTMRAATHKGAGLFASRSRPDLCAGRRSAGGH